MSTFKFPSGFTVENLTDDEVQQLDQAQLEAQANRDLRAQTQKLTGFDPEGTPGNTKAVKAVPIIQADGTMDFAAHLAEVEYGLKPNGAPSQTKAAPGEQLQQVDFAADLVSKQFSFDAQGKPVSTKQPSIYKSK